MSSALDSKLSRVENTQQSIKTLSTYMQMMLDASTVQGWVKSLDAALQGSPFEHQNTILNLLSDVLFNTQRKGAEAHAVACGAFLPVIRRAFALIASVGGEGVAKLRRLCALWKDRGLLGEESVAALSSALEAPRAALLLEKDSAALLALAARRAGSEGSSASSSASSASSAAEDISLSPSTPIPALVAALVQAGQALHLPSQDPSALLRSSAEGRALDDCQRAAEEALGALDQSDIAVRMSGESAAGLRALCSRAFVLEERVAAAAAAAAAAGGGSRKRGREGEGQPEGEGLALEAARSSLLRESTPFEHLPATLAAARRHTAALREERRCRSAAMDAISAVFAVEQEGGWGGRGDRLAMELARTLDGLASMEAQVREAAAERRAGEAAAAGRERAAAEAAAAAAAAAAAGAAAREAAAAAAAAASAAAAFLPRQGFSGYSGSSSSSSAGGGSGSGSGSVSSNPLDFLSAAVAVGQGRALAAAAGGGGWGGPPAGPAATGAAVQRGSVASTLPAWMRQQQ